MNTERLFNVILLELSTDKLKLEDDLEQTINAQYDIGFKADKIKDILDKLSKTETTIARLKAMLTNNNNTEEKTE